MENCDGGGFRAYAASLKPAGFLFLNSRHH
jgi:hypothetical protein